jgi:hypothetical protein
MAQLASETGGLNYQVKQATQQLDEAQKRYQKLEATGSQLQNQIETVSRQLSERLAKVLPPPGQAAKPGEPAPARTGQEARPGPAPQPASAAPARPASGVVPREAAARPAAVDPLAAPTLRMEGRPAGGEARPPAAQTPAQGPRPGAPAAQPTAPRTQPAAPQPSAPKPQPPAQPKEEKSVFSRWFKKNE